MEFTEYIIFGFCILGVGYTSYNIGHREGLDQGIKLGAGFMFEKFWAMGKPRKRDPQVRYIEMTKDEIILK